MRKNIKLKEEETPIDGENKEIKDVPFMTETDDLEKGLTLMQQALKQYSDGKYSLANHSRKEANKFFDKVENNLSDEEGVEKAMYGENRNFGLIYNVIEENAKHLYETVEGREKIGKIITFIKSDNVLINEFKVYDAFICPRDVENAEDYINEALSVIDRLPVKEIREANSKLAKTVKSLKLDENIYVDETFIKLCEAIEYTLLNKPTISNVREYTKTKAILKESVVKNNRNSKKRVDIDALQDNGVENIVEKYNKELNEEEKKLVAEIATSNEKAQKRFNQMKVELISLLNEKIESAEDSDKEGWKHIYETVSQKTFSPESALSLISDLIELKETIE